MSQVDDVNYGNIFGGKISNNITIAGGGIYYGVDKIEEYNDLAQFEGFSHTIVVLYYLEYQIRLKVFILD